MQMQDILNHLDNYIPSNRASIDLHADFEPMPMLRDIIAHIDSNLLPEKSAIMLALLRAQERAESAREAVSDLYQYLRQYPGTASSMQSAQTYRSVMHNRFVEASRTQLEEQQ